MTNHNTENIVLDGTLVSKLRADIEDLFDVVSVEAPRHIRQRPIRSGRAVQDKSVHYPGRSSARGLNVNGLRAVRISSVRRVRRLLHHHMKQDARLITN